MGFPLGDQWKLWRNSGTIASPTWTKVTCIENMSLGFDREIVEMPCRDDVRIGGKPAKLKMPLTFTLRYSDTDANATAMRNNALSGTKMHFNVTLEDPAAPNDQDGLEYFTDEWYVGGFPLGMNLSEGSSFEMSLIPAVDVDSGLTSSLGTVNT